MQLKTWLVIAAVALLIVPGSAVAAPGNSSDSSAGEDDNGGDTVVEIDLSKVISALQDLISVFESFRENWDDSLEELLMTVFFGPFLALLKYLVTQLMTVLTHTPTVYPNPAVEEIWELCYIITISLTGAAISMAGILYMIGPLLGVSYSAVRKVLPRIILALIFASVSLPLLQYAVDLSNALTYAFQPEGLETSLGETFGTSTTLVLVGVINAGLLLVVVIMFIFRNMYLLFTAAISPLLALGWSLPKVKRYSDTFIAGFWTALAMGPLDMLVLRFSFALMQGNGVSTGQSLANWLYGMASLVLLIWVPLQLYGASQAAIGQAYVLSRGVKRRVGQYRRKKSQQSFRRKKLESLREDRRNRRQRRRRGRY